MPSPEPTFVLVHGAFANSFSFAPLQAELALRGFRSLAVDLPGHGFEATFPAAYQAPQDLAELASARVASRASLSPTTWLASSRCSSGPRSTAR